MRTPTPLSELMQWHNQALAGKNPPIHESEPRLGWFKVRMVRGGPFVPARIYTDREICPETGELMSDERFLCEVDGEPRDPVREWVWLAKNPISEMEYHSLCELRHQIAQMAATHVPLDLGKTLIGPSRENLI